MTSSSSPALLSSDMHEFLTSSPAHQSSHTLLSSDSACRLIPLRTFLYRSRRITLEILPLPDGCCRCGCLVSSIPVQPVHPYNPYTLTCTLTSLHTPTRTPLHPTTYTLTPLHPYTLTPLHPYTLTPLHPTPLHPNPYTLHPYTLHPLHPLTFNPTLTLTRTLTLALALRLSPNPDA
jgi:hypothetical protein